MNNLSLLLLGLALINVPVCLSQSDKQCFSLPDYPCCKGNKVVYTDESGNWGIENNQWCGIIETPKDTCFSSPLYPCCESCVVLYTDEDGDWGVENGNWCGIKEECSIVPVPEDFDFDFSFLKIENEKVNKIYSPLSIKYALAMLKEGAEGNTSTEINNIIGNTELSKYKNIEKVLSLANGLFLRDTYYEHVNPEFINILKEKYDTEVVKDEFKDAKNANQWIENKTLGIIKNMLEDYIVSNPDNLMILINALAIDMEWNSGFSYQSTHGRTFYLDNGKETKVTMMGQFDRRDKGISYYLDRNITVVTMDLKKYDDVQFEFMAIMPKENLSDYVEKVSKEEINQIDERLKSSYDTDYGVDLRIPKFIFEYNLELKEDLQKIGIKNAFIPFTANFTKINDIDELFVSEALHKANIEFTEEGIKAAAVTVFTMLPGAAMPVPTYPVEITFDKPFMFIIREKTTKDIWFTGTVYQPNLWENDQELYDPRSPSPNKKCKAMDYGYPCCKTTTKVEYIDEDGEWGVENGDWCNIILYH